MITQQELDNLKEMLKSQDPGDIVLAWNLVDNHIQDRSSMTQYTSQQRKRNTNY